MSTPLRHLLHSVLFDESTRSQLAADPEGFLSEHGWTELAGAELEEAVVALADSLPVETTRAIEDSRQAIDFSGDSIAEVGADLAALADQVDLDLPTTITPEASEPDLDFGAGAEGAPDADLDEPSAAIDVDIDSGEFAELEWDPARVDLADPADLDTPESFVADIDDIDEPDLTDGDGLGFDLEG